MPVDASGLRAFELKLNCEEAHSTRLMLTLKAFTILRISENHSFCALFFKNRKHFKNKFHFKGSSTLKFLLKSIITQENTNTYSLSQADHKTL